MHLRNSKWFVVLLKADLCRAQAQGTERNLSFISQQTITRAYTIQHTTQGKAITRLVIYLPYLFNTLPLSMYALSLGLLC